MKIGFVTMEKTDNRPKDSVGSSRIRARWVYENWPEAEEYMIGKKYDVLIFQKVYWEKMITAFEGIKILDLCDPDWLEGKDVMRFVNLCDATTTSTEELAKYIRKFTDKPVVCIPDRIELKEHTNQKTEHRETCKDAVWFGYQHNQHYIQNTLEHLMTHGMKLTVISNYAYTPPEATSIVVTNTKFAYPKIHSDLIEADIALLPSTYNEDLKGHYKSNNKTLTCWALGIPVIREPEDIKDLLTQEQREQEAKKRLQEIKDKWDVKLSVQEYKDLIKALQDGNKNKS